MPRAETVCTSALGIFHHTLSAQIYFVYLSDLIMWPLYISVFSKQSLENTNVFFIQSWAWRDKNTCTSAT